MVSPTPGSLWDQSPKEMEAGASGRHLDVPVETVEDEAEDS